MQAVRLRAWMLVLAAGLACGGEIPKEEYRVRRDALRKTDPDGVTVLFGRADKDAGDFRSRFIQEPNFYYLTGWLEPDARVIVAPDGDILFLPAHNAKAEVYTGRRLAPGDAGVQAATGFENVLPLESFENRLFKLIESRGKLYALFGSPAEQKLRAMLPLREFADAADAIGKLRLKKSFREIEQIQRSVDATIAGHRAAWRRIGPGLYEYQVAASLTSAWLELGCEGNAYPPITGSGRNATVLHYEGGSRRMDSGDLLLIDAGAECGDYAADVTRTVPVNGAFTPRQRELYEVVLAAQKLVLASVRPGMTLEKGTPNSLNDIAYDYINTHGKDLRGEPLGKYVLHTIGHHVGLDVHDAGKLLKHGPLEPGMVIAIEPGLYIAEEGIGIRIEDTVLVTERGGRVMSSALPKEATEIEKALVK